MTWIAGHDCFVSIQFLARSNQLEHGWRVWVVEPDVVLLEIRSSP